MILKISLKPLDKFFFGGENSFLEAGADDNRRSTYLLHSSNYPQQTSLLGLIRNQMLLQNGLLWDNSASISDRNEAQKLIGAHGFKTNYTQPYGVIQALSAVFLSNADDEHWWPAPLDDSHMDAGKNPPYLQLKKSGTKAILEGYSEKSGLTAHIQQICGASISLEDSFATQERVGITKAARPWGDEVKAEDDEHGYYYQGFQSFAAAKDCEKRPDRFCLYVKIQDGINEKLASSIVEMGGERSTFIMDVEEMDGISELPQPPAVRYVHTSREAGIRSLVCMSPCLVIDLAALRQLSALMVTRTVSFRFLQSETDATDHHQDVSRNKKHIRQGSLTESKLFQLLDRGSVIHFEPGNEQAIIQLFHHAGLENIGYNQYCIL